MERSVLIVESQSDFALAMATVLRTVGYQTATVSSAAAAQRALEERRPDLVVLRAELPDMSGFTLCGQIKKGQWGQYLKVLLVSSDSGVDGLNHHRQTQSAADGYLLIPFAMEELASLSSHIVPLSPSENSAAASREAPGAPQHEHRTALTQEDHAFLEQVFQSIADRRTELLAESRQARRSPPRREGMSTPEEQIQLLRDDLRVREAQLARLSELWSVREQEHGATVDDLLLQKFSTEKELIELIAAKEQEIHLLKEEAGHLNADREQQRATPSQERRSGWRRG